MLKDFLVRYWPETTGQKLLARNYWPETSYLWKLILTDEELHDIWHKTGRVANDEDDDHDDGGPRVLGVPLLQLVLVDAGHASEAEVQARADLVRFAK